MNERGNIGDLTCMFFSLHHGKKYYSFFLNVNDNSDLQIMYVFIEFFNIKFCKSKGCF